MIVMLRINDLPSVEQVPAGSSKYSKVCTIQWTFRLLRAAGETETTQENIQDWLELDDGDPGFQLLTEEEIAAVLIYIYFH
jgi:hypothetical protein